MVQKLSRRVIRTLRHLGYLEAGIDDACTLPFTATAGNGVDKVSGMVKVRGTFGFQDGSCARSNQCLGVEM